jgi:hypothetical protein
VQHPAAAATLRAGLFRKVLIDMEQQVIEVGIAGIQMAHCGSLRGLTGIRKKSATSQSKQLI